jgi:hypothetical protein
MDCPTQKNEFLKSYNNGYIYIYVLNYYIETVFNFRQT